MSLDQRLFAAINEQWTNPVLDRIAALVRASEIWLGPLVVLLALMLTAVGYLRLRQRARAA